MKQMDTKKFDDSTLTIFLDVGQVLLKARQEQNLTIRQVADIIHIRQKYLVDIEQGRLHDLPGRVYTLGFIRTYARLLNLDGEELIRRMGTIPNLEQEQFQMPLIHPSEENPNYRVIFVSVIMAILTALAGYFFLRSPVDELPASLPKETIDLPASTISPDPSYDKLTEPATLPLAHLEKQESQRANILIADRPRVDSLKKSADNRLFNENEVIVKAVEPTWLEIRDSNGKAIFMKVLQRGEEFKMQEHQGVIMNVGNAGGLDIYFGTVKIAPLGERGEVKRGILLTSLKP
jgi:cytoskeleton protein RodZ